VPKPPSAGDSDSPDENRSGDLLPPNWAELAPLPVYFRAGHFTEARALAARDSNRSMLARLGDPEAAREALRTLDAEPPRRGQAGRRADLYLALGDTANALSALERAAADSGLWPITLDMGDSKYDAIRHSARFRELLERVGLHDYVSTFTR